MAVYWQATSASTTAIEWKRREYCRSLAPNDDADDKQKENFNSKLRLITDNISSRKEIVIIWDLNARTGSKRNDPVIYSFLGNSPASEF